MTTPAVTPASPITPILTQISWLKAHERIVCLFLCLVVAGWIGNKYLDNAAARSETRATVAEQALASQKAQDAANASTVAQVTQQYAAIVQTLQAQNASLASSLAQRQASLVVAQKTDTTLALPDLANRLKTIGNAPDGSVSASGGQILLTQPGAVAVVQTLEEVPVLTSNLADQTTISSNFQAELVKANEVILDQTKQISGLNLTLTGETDTCKAQVAALTAKARRAKLRYFWVGVVAGFIGRSVIH